MNTISIEVVSDHVCPWCYVGKRRLEKAIARRPELDIRVSWLPFQLSPDLPREGLDRVEYYKQKFGEDRAQQIMESMQDTGLEEGIAFDTKPGARSPNTLSAHVLMLWAGENDNVDTNELIEKLFHAHHVVCEDIGDHAVLSRIAGEVGMNAAEVSTGLATGEDEDKAGALMQDSIERGVSGVPFFIVNGRYGISGAQPAEELVAAFDQISDQLGGEQGGVTADA
jgi:predicted DsbA family dithiol-disulfide isomerase